MNKLSLLAGVDIPIPALQLTLHQPAIREIAYMGEMNYFSTLQLLCFDKNVMLASNPEGASYLSIMNDFQIFMTLIDINDESTRSKILLNLQALFTILFPGYQLQVIPQGLGLCLSNAKTKHSVIINDTNFDTLKESLMEITGVRNSVGSENSNFNPKNKKAAEIAAKILKGRSRVAANKGYSADGVLGRYVSILTVGLSSMSLDKCLGLTVYQLYDLIERYGLYVGWDLDIRSRLAGGTPDNKPDDWMKDLH